MIMREGIGGADKLPDTVLAEKAALDNAVKAHVSHVNTLIASLYRTPNKLPSGITKM